MSTAPHDRSERQAKIDAAAPKEGRLRPLLITLVGVVAVLAIVGAIWWGGRGNDTPASGGNGRTYPVGATGEAGGIVVNADKVKPGAPTLDVYEDFQCPACKSAEDQLGPTMKAMAQAGEVKLVFHMKNFLEKNPQINNDSSTRAALAASCAADAGKFEAFHDIVFKNQPQEGVGYTDAQMQQYAQQAGITGSAFETWKTCNSAKTYVDYVNKVEDTTARAGVTGTPTFRVNGKPFDLGKVASVADFRAKVLAAGGATATSSTTK